MANKAFQSSRQTTSIRSFIGISRFDKSICVILAEVTRVTGGNRGEEVDRGDGGDGFDGVDGGDVVTWM